MFAHTQTHTSRCVIVCPNRDEVSFISWGLSSFSLPLKNIIINIDDNVGGKNNN